MQAACSPIHTVPTLNTTQYRCCSLGTWTCSGSGSPRASVAACLHHPFQLVERTTCEIGTPRPAAAAEVPGRHLSRTLAAADYAQAHIQPWHQHQGHGTNTQQILNMWQRDQKRTAAVNTQRCCTPQRVAVGQGQVPAVRHNNVHAVLSSLLLLLPQLSHTHSVTLFATQKPLDMPPHGSDPSKRYAQVCNTSGLRPAQQRQPAQPGKAPQCRTHTTPKPLPSSSCCCYLTTKLACVLAA